MNRVHSILAVSALSILTTTAFAGFSECKFNFGRQWSNSFSSTTSFSGQGLSHLAIWLGDNATYNQYWEGSMAKAAKSNNLTPVIYAYVIAEYGKDNGLSDCDVGNPNHCTGGSNMIRNNWSGILSRYQSYAQGIADDFGTASPTIWLIEPDFMQYSVTGDALNTKYAQSGGGVPDAELCGKYFNQIVSTIKAALPNAKIAVDISPWINSGLSTWYGNFDKSKIDYAFTSGGRTQGNTTRIRSDNNNTVTWAQVSAALGGKKIIADDGYGVGGSSNSDYEDWMNLSNINSRISDGVIGITIQEPASSFTSFANSNSNITVACGTTPTSSSVTKSSSSTTPSSSSVTKSSSSTKQSSSSVTKSSSSIKQSSSSVTKSSSSIASSSSTIVSSSSAIIEGSWTATNASLANSTTAGVSIGTASDWNTTRTVSMTLGTVTAGTSYTLTFAADISRGGQSMDVAVALGSNCNQTLTLSGSAIENFSCTFTAASTQALTLILTVPAQRWETVTITNLALTGPNGNIITGGTPTHQAITITQNKAILLRNGSTQNWQVPQLATIEVFNIMGKKVVQKSAASPLDLSRLPAGIYVLRAQSGPLFQSLRINNF